MYFVYSIFNKVYIWNKKMVMLIILCTVILLSFVLVLVFYKEEPSSIDKGRPSASFMKPDFSGNVTDVRITTVKREYNGTEFDSNRVMQLYYGYCIDDVWYDIPCENYDLIGICDNKGNYGYDAAGDDHIVKIGNKIVFAFSTTSFYDSQLKDSLDSKTYEITDYFTKSFTTKESNGIYYGVSTVGDGYSYLKEKALAYDDDEYEYMIVGKFDKWYYLVVDESELDETYQITFNELYEHEEDITLDYEDIKNALNSKAQ